MRSHKKRVLFVYGTRPEAIKIAPLILEFKKYPEHFEVVSCVTGQHREMLAQVLDFFGIVPDIDLKLMTRGQSSIDFMAKASTQILKVINRCQPDIVFVQGDTNTAFIAGLVAKHCNVEVAHLEAGLRSNNKLSPFPEEINRVMLSNIISS